jgi:hypothetical protein
MKEVLGKTENRHVVEKLCKDCGILQELFLMGQGFIQQIIESRYNMSMSSSIQDHPSTKEKQYILSVTDRCDQCSAQALVLIKGSTGELMFCGHHYDKIMNNPDAYTKMMAFMLEVVDEREKIV